jgi:hypothetical protein
MLYRPSDELVAGAGTWADGNLAEYQATVSNIGDASPRLFLTISLNRREKATMAKGAEYGKAVVRKFNTTAGLLGQ